MDQARRIAKYKEERTSDGIGGVEKSATISYQNGGFRVCFLDKKGIGVLLARSNFLYLSRYPLYSLLLQSKRRTS